MIRSAIWIIGLFLFSATLLAQDSTRPAQGEQLPKNDDNYTLSVDVELVQVPVSVVDKDGRIVSGLTQDHFEIFEDKVRQEISLFRNEDIPVSMGLVIDNSGSMRDKRERVNSAALSFIRESNPDDETFIINFDDEAYLEQGFTGSIGDLVDALDNIDTRGETALHDAIYLATEHVQEEGRLTKKALLIVSDGEDNKSKYGYNVVLDRVREAKDITIYAIGLLEENDQRGGIFRKSPSKKAREALTELAQLTGGQAYFPKSLEEVEELCKRIAHDIRNQYTIEYSPSNKKLDGTWRNVSVQVTPPRNVSKVTLFHKSGYYAPNIEGVSDKQ